MRLNKLFFILIILILSTCLKTAICDTQIELNLGTASMGGAYYPLGQGLSSLVNEYTENISMVPVVTGGSFENPRLASEGDIDFGIANTELAYFGYIGENMYEEKLNISVVIPLHPGVFHMVALAESSVNTVSDFKGKKVGVGAAGGTTISMLESVFTEYGFSIDDIIPSFLSYEDEMSQLKDFNLDVCCLNTAIPAPAVTQTIVTHDIKFIGLESDHMKNLLAKYPYYSETIIPKDIYKLTEDANAISIDNVLVVRNDLDEDIVYKVTKAIIENLEELREIDSSAKQIDLRKINSMPIPFHPGAEKYLKEIGLL